MRVTDVCGCVDPKPNCSCRDVKLFSEPTLIKHEWAIAEIERLRKALATINAWYPISVSRPMDTVRDIMDFANKTLNGEKK